MPKKLGKKLNENKSRTVMAMSSFCMANFFCFAPTANSQLIHLLESSLTKNDLKATRKNLGVLKKCNNEVFEEISYAICRNDSHFSIAKAQAFTLKHFILRSTLVIKLGMTSEEGKNKDEKRIFQTKKDESESEAEDQVAPALNETEQKQENHEAFFGNCFNVIVKIDSDNDPSPLTHSNISS